MKRNAPVMVVMMLLLVGAALVSAEPVHDREALFFRANEAYGAGRFQEAAQAYEQLIGSGPAGGDVYYNLGNCYVKLHRLGMALLNYERARILIPRDADLAYNSSYTIKQTLDKITPERHFLDNAFFWTDSLTRPEAGMVFAVINILLWTLLLVRLWRRSEWSFYALLVCTAVWFVSGSALGWKWYGLAHDSRAVVIVDEAQVLAGPDSQDTLLFKLHDGAMAIRERREPGWDLIRISKDKRGWIRQDQLKSVRRTGQSSEDGSKSPVGTAR